MEAINNQEKYSESLNYKETYKGKYLDVYGHEGEIQLELIDDSEGLRCECQIIVANTDYSSTFKTQKGKELIFQNKLFSGKQGFDIHLSHISLEANKEDSEALSLNGEFTIQMSEAKPFAPKVIFGTINLNGDPGIGGGVWMAWQL